MKYIRTKGSIYEGKKINDNTFLINGRNGHKYKMRINHINFVNEADTIEELCDEFVITNGKIHQTTKAFDKIKEYFNPYDIFYGAIWTDKGLKYIAKMNKEGDLELI